MASSHRTSLLGAGQVISSSKKPESETVAPDLTTPQKGLEISPQEMANAIRFLAIDAVESAQSGHPGMPMGTADIITTLFTRFISFDPHRPDWFNRDRFILSAGHGSMMLYALLYLIGVEGITIDDIKNFRQLGSRTPGHPERGCLPGVEVTTGPLGQGLAMGVGMAIAERQMHSVYSHASDEIVNHSTYVLASDGDLMEGISHEAISLAGHLQLSQLIVLHDNNQITIDGNINLAGSGDVLARFGSAGWHSVSIDGHDVDAIASAITNAQKSDQPSFISCETKIGFGAPNKEGSEAVHGSPLGVDEVAATRQKLHWQAKPFEVPEKILDAWRIAGLRMAKKSGPWQKKWDALPENIKGELTRRGAGDLPDGTARALSECKRQLAREKTMATRTASGVVIERLNELLPEIIGGSADLTGSNNTKAAAQEIFSAENHSGKYIHYGVREHAMAAIMNGMAAHGAMLPYGGTFLIFSDYCRPAIRLAALMGLRVIFVLTHDSIGLGEDGPTHQPIEHLASLRAIPGLNVFRPADSVETAECWDIAIRQKNNPSAILLTRQKVTTIRNAQTEENRSRQGAYQIRGVDGAEDATLIASGSELELALQARRLLAARRVAARVVSVPCLDIFTAQSPEYQAQILGDSNVRCVIEASTESNWQRIAGGETIFIGLNQFGASAPAEELFPHFGLTPDAIAEAVLDVIEKNKEKAKEKSKDKKR